MCLSVWCAVEAVPGGVDLTLPHAPCFCQILFRAAIRRHGCDTSYNALARRARAGNGVGNGSLEAWVCSGSIAQRITNFGEDRQPWRQGWRQERWQGMAGYPEDTCPPGWVVFVQRQHRTTHSQSR